MKKKFIFFLIISSALTLFTVKFICLYRVAQQHSKVQNTSASSYNLFSNNNVSNLNTPKSANSLECFNTSGNIIITIPEFIYNMQCKEYTIQKGETLTSIAKNYVSTCPINSSVKLIKEASKITNADSISSGTKIYIPETILKNGYIHITESGDNWSKLCRDYYPIYDVNSMTNLLIFINDLPDKSIPIGTEIYLPNINI